MDVTDDGNGRPEPDESKVRFSKASRRIVKLLVFALVIHLFVVPQIGGARKAVGVLGTVNPLLIALAVVFEGASLLAYAWLTRLLLSREDRPRLPVVFGAVLASTGVNHVVPGGAATTAAVNYRLLGNAGVPRDSLGFALATQAIGSAVVLNAILWVALVISIPTTGFHPIYASAAAVGAVLIGVFAAAVLSIRRGSEAFADRVARWAAHLPRLNADSLRKTMLGLAEQLDLLSRDRQRMLLVVALAAANWLLDAAALWVTLTAFGSSPGLVGLLVAYGLANVMAAIPVSPGGLGVVEAILIPTLVGFGTPAAVASIGVVAYRLVGFWLPIPVGALAYLLVDRATAAGAGSVGFRGEVNQQLGARS